jgi:putative ABC transport system substrate-binding protein
MKRTIVYGLVGGMTLGAMWGCKKKPPNPPKRRIYICKVVDHPAINSVVEGIQSFVEQSGQMVEWKVESAQGNVALAAQIAAKFVNKHPSVVIAIGTMPAQCFAKYAREKQCLLVFSSVTNPVAAGLTDGNPLEDNNITGVSNFVELDPQLDLFCNIQPRLRRIGMLYNPAEVNSVVILTKMENLCAERHIVLTKQSVAKTADISQAALKLVNDVDAIFVSNDNTVLSGIKNVVKVANEARIPVYVSDTDAVLQAGCLAALGPNQFKIGEQTGKMALNVIENGRTIGIPVEYPDGVESYINLKAIRVINFNLAKEKLGEFDVVVDEAHR